MQIYADKIRRISVYLRPMYSQLWFRADHTLRLLPTSSIPSPALPVHNKERRRPGEGERVMDDG